MANYLRVNKANVLIVYDNVLKNPDPYILRRLVTTYRDKFKRYIDVETIETISDELLLSLVVNRAKKNVLEQVAITEFDYELNYNILHEKFLDMYQNSIPLQMYQTLINFYKSYCIDHIYVYNPTYDKRQHFDIETVFKDMRNLQYVVGDMEDVINQIGDINVLYDWDVDRVNDLVSTGLHDDIFFGVAQYPFNFEKDKLHLKHSLWKMDNVSYFPLLMPIKMNNALG